MKNFTRTLPQRCNVRHLIIKGGNAKITDVNGRIMKRNVKLQLQVFASSSIEEANVIKHKDVAGTVTLKNAAMLCQLWNVRHLIIKGGIAKITDVNGRIMNRNVKEGGVGAPEIIYRSRL